MIFKDFYHTCNIETFPRKLIKDFELKLQWQCAGLLENFLELQKAANLQDSSLIDWKVILWYNELMIMGLLMDTGGGSGQATPYFVWRWP